MAIQQFVIVMLIAQFIIFIKSHQVMVRTSKCPLLKGIILGSISLKMNKSLMYLYVKSMLLECPKSVLMSS